MNFSRACATAAAALLPLLFTVPGTGVAAEPAPDWPAWRGAQGDGVSLEKNWNPEIFKQGAPKVLWKAKVENGHSTVAIVGDRLYTMGNKGGRDIVFCLDVNCGREVWRFAYPVKAGNPNGPSATPVVDDGVVYTLGRDGDAHALDAKSGTLKWKHNLVTDFGAKPPSWGFAASARVAGNMVLFNAGEKGIALDKKSGGTLWASSGLGGYAVPVLFDYRGKRCAAMFAWRSLAIVNVADGAVVVSYPWETVCDVNAADPIVADGKIFISSGYEKGCTLLDLSGDQPKPLWTNTLMRSHFSSPLRWDNTILGVDGDAGGGTFVCLDWESGKELWRAEIGFGSCLRVGDCLLYLNERGKMYVLKPDAKAMKIMSVGKDLLGPTCWTPPVFCRGKVYLRNDKGDLVCLDMGFK